MRVGPAKLFSEWSIARRFGDSETAYETWGQSGGFPQGFTQLLDQLDSRLARVGATQPIDVSFEPEPNDASIMIVPAYVSD
jgi:hypothetical protein